MRNLEHHLTLENLNNAKPYLVPYVFSQNYFNILKARLRNKKLSDNERYYYNHFIKKKLQGMFELFEITNDITGKEFIRKDKLKKAISLLKKYSRKHKNMKILISGSFLYSDKFNDIDIFIISKYNKEDYRDGRIHVNYLPDDIEKTLFFKSISAISIANFKFDKIQIEEEIKAEDILHLYELVTLLIMQKDSYLPELRNLLLRMEYTSNRVVLNSMQLKTAADRIINSKNPIKLINKYVIAKIISSYNVAVLRKALKKFIEKNSIPEKGQKMYENWKIYNQTYNEALEVVA
ncbi:MAG: hypothetical protein U9R34_06505 [Nanoarchaeota archaeon]|nr:hypothetical protein [Nanoarchaeota archaeon]